VGNFCIGLVLFVLAVVLPLLRQTGFRSWQTLWAEDGAIYFDQATQYGSIAVLFRGYEGYLQLPPRVFGAFASLLPISDLAIYFAITSAIGSALLVWFTYRYCEGWIVSRPVRLALASLVVTPSARLVVPTTRSGPFIDPDLCVPSA
jgi:hypothetical protein